MTPEPTDLSAVGGMPPTEFTADPSRVREVAEDQLSVPDDLVARLAAETVDLVLDPAVVRQMAVALIAGNLVLQGPPGTGKTELAQRLARAFGADLEIVTAHEDWTTYDVIGRQELAVVDGQEEVVPVDGHVVRSILKCAAQIVAWEDAEHGEVDQASWLLVDELNRSHFDRAFGELFTALGSDQLVPVQLSHRAGVPLVVPRRFRIVATLNTVDRQFVNNLSQALRRRFTFVTIDVPPPPPAGAVLERGVGNDAVLAVREYDVVLGKGLAGAMLRIAGREDDFDAALDAAEPALRDLFAVVHQLRAGGDAAGPAPYLPVGPATLIDVVKSALIDSVLYGTESAASVDGAAALRIAPLLEAEVIEPEKLRQYAQSLPAGFGLLRGELERIAALGLYAV
jgi:5-methylcytosine-specific restriction protein B